MEVEHCIRADGEEIRNFLHRIKKAVDKGWPDDMVGIALGDQIAECTAQARQKRQRYIEHTKGTQTPICTTKSSRIFNGTSECDLGMIFRPT